MLKLKTSYNHALQGFLNYEKGLKGKVSLKEMKELNRGFRKIYNEILIDTEKAIEAKRQLMISEVNALPKESPKKDQLVSDFQKEVATTQEAEAEVEMMASELDAIAKALGDIQFDSSDEKKVLSTRTLMLLDEFLEQVQSAVDEKPKK